jgi:hypothetical protein
MSSRVHGRRQIAARAATLAAAHAASRLAAPPEQAAAATPATTRPGPSSSGRPLPESTRQHMEAAFGHDFSRVRVHEGPQAESLGAVAYTQGHNLHFAPGKFRPESSEGKRLLGHELTHVVQQRAGRVAVPQGKGPPINADPHLEAEADQAGAEAAHGAPVAVTGAARRSLAGITSRKRRGSGVAAAGGLAAGSSRPPRAPGRPALGAGGAPRVQLKCSVCGAKSHSAGFHNPPAKKEPTKTAEQIRARMAKTHHQKTGVRGTPKKRLEKWKEQGIKEVEERLKKRDDEKDNGGAGGGISVLV